MTRGRMRRLNMAQARHRSASYADIEALPPNVVGEILFGHLVTHPRPGPRHGGASSSLGALAVGAYQFGVGGPGGWIFIIEPELHLGEHVVVPDIAGWRRERFSERPDKAYFDIAPDWVCEVISPSTERYDRCQKRKIYAQFGVAHLWLLDPNAQILEVFALQGDDWLLLAAFQGTQEVTAAPFDELKFSLSLLWPFDMPPEGT